MIWMRLRSLTVTAVALAALLPVASTMGCKKPQAEGAKAEAAAPAAPPRLQPRRCRAPRPPRRSSSA